MFYVPPLHLEGIFCASVPDQKTVWWSRTAFLNWPAAKVTVSFSETIYKPPVSFLLSAISAPSTLWFPLQSFSCTHPLSFSSTCGSASITKDLLL